MHTQIFLAILCQKLACKISDIHKTDSDFGEFNIHHKMIYLEYQLTDIIKPKSELDIYCYSKILFG